jgi:hypothetical protein
MVGERSANSRSTTVEGPEPLATFASGALVPRGARIRMFEPEFVRRVGRQPDRCANKEQ